MQIAAFAASAAERAEISRELALAQFDVSQYAEAAVTLSAALREAPADLDATARDALRVDLLALALLVPGLDQEQLIADLSRGAPPEDPAVLVGIEFGQLAQNFNRGAPVDAYSPTLERLAADNPPAPHRADFHTVCWLGLVMSERFEAVRSQLQAVEADGPGWARRRAAVHHARAWLEHRLGNLDEAVAVGESALEFPTDDLTGEMVHRAHLSAVLLERGDELGAGLRRANHRADAREPLHQALTLAHTCGARPLAAQARDELILAGARPRRDAGTGRDSLTPAELRVAKLIADGGTNRQIAQRLFITPKTVEGHASHILRKLGVSSRVDVARALADA